MNMAHEIQRYCLEAQSYQNHEDKRASNGSVNRFFQTLFCLFKQFFVGATKLFPKCACHNEE